MPLLHSGRPHDTSCGARPCSAPDDDAERSERRDEDGGCKGVRRKVGRLAHDHGHHARPPGGLSEVREAAHPCGRRSKRRVGTLAGAPPGAVLVCACMGRRSSKLVQPTDRIAAESAGAGMGRGAPRPPLRNASWGGEGPLRRPPLTHGPLHRNHTRCCQVVRCAPALTPVDPAKRSPRFLMMKLAPMKRDELTASPRPMSCSEACLSSTPLLPAGSLSCSSEEARRSKSSM